MDFPVLTALVKNLTNERLPWGEAAVSIGGETVYRFSSGFSAPENGIVYEPGSRGMYYSVTKVVTAACAMKLVEEGALCLDTDIGSVLPAFSDLKTADGENARVTVRDLLSMSSGFSYDAKCFSGKRAVSSLREAIEPLARVPLAFTPGSHWLYGFGMDILAAVMELLTGRSVSSLIREKFFAPFGIHGPVFHHENTDPGAVVPLFKTMGAGYERVPLDTSMMPSPLACSGGAGLTGNAEDMARFLSLLSAGRILKEETLDLMTRDTLTPSSRPDCFWPSLKGYGYGLGVRTLIDKASSPSPLGEFGWGGQAGSYALVDRQRKLGFCFMTHVVGQSETNLFCLLRDSLYEDLAKA